MGWNRQSRPATSVRQTVAERHKLNAMLSIYYVLWMVVVRYPPWYVFTLACVIIGQGQIGTSTCSVPFVCFEALAFDSWAFGMKYLTSLFWIYIWNDLSSVTWSRLAFWTKMQSIVLQAKQDTSKPITTNWLSCLEICFWRAILSNSGRTYCVSLHPVGGEQNKASVPNPAMLVCTLRAASIPYFFASVVLRCIVPKRLLVLF